MKKKDVLSIYDLSAKEIKSILNKALELKKKRKTLKVLDGKTVGLIFEKNSTRTMVSFAAGTVQLGGTPIILHSQNLQRGRGESIHDTALVLSSYLDAIMIRAFKHCDVEELAKYSSIPVINGLTDYEHPCQILADIMTIAELHKAKTVEKLKKLKIVFIGDSNNVANSLIAITALLGLKLTIISPKQYAPRKEVLLNASKHAHLTKAKITVSSDIGAAKDADVLYTDVWTSMGEEKEEKYRTKALAPYQINSNLLKSASSNAIVLHCLPAKRGQEITAEIMYKYEKSIFTQAENRLHAQKALLLHLLK